MPITLEPFVRFTCFNFCFKALDFYFHAVIRPLQATEFRRRRRLLQTAFWNRWTLALDFGPGNAGLWTEISGNLGPKTHKICCIHVLILDLCVLRLRILDSGDKSTCIITKKTLGSKVGKISENFVCFWAEISVQSPAFPSPKSRPRVQRFQNAD